MLPSVQQIDELWAKYRSRGTMTGGGHFLLDREDTLAIIDDLVAMGVTVIACDLWQRVEGPPAGYMELTGGGTEPPGEQWHTISAQDAAALIKQFLTDPLPYGADHVLLQLRDGDIGTWFSERDQAMRGGHPCT